MTIFLEAGREKEELLVYTYMVCARLGAAVMPLRWVNWLRKSNVAHPKPSGTKIFRKN